MRRQRTQTGDVFAIEIDEARYAYGQIILKSHTAFPLYICVFEPAFPLNDPADSTTICRSEIALVGGTADGRIYHGMWKVIGNAAPVSDRIPRPYFTVLIRGQAVLEDFDGTIVRTATPNDIRMYGKRWSRAPMGFELATKALHGVGKWEDSYSKLTYRHSYEQAILCDA